MDKVYCEDCCYWSTNYPNNITAIQLGKDICMIHIHIAPSSYGCRDYEEMSHL